MIKYKCVIHSVLVFELYKIIYGFNIRAIIKATLGKVLESAILLILFTNLKSLYNCLVKLDIIQENQLIIDMMSLY